MVLSIHVCRGLGISPLRINIWLIFSQADLGPKSAQELFLSGFFKSLIFFSKICAYSGRCINILAGIFEIQLFFGNTAFPLSPVLMRVQMRIMLARVQKPWPKSCIQLRDRNSNAPCMNLYRCGLTPFGRLTITQEQHISRPHVVELKELGRQR